MGRKAKSGKPQNSPRIFDRPDWPKRRETVLLYVSGGYYVEDSIIAAGFSRQWWYKWQAIADKEIERAQALADENGEDDFRVYVDKDLLVAIDFVDAIRQRQSATIIANAAKIRKTNPLEYNARVRPEQWGRRDRMLLGNDPDNPMPENAVHVYLPDNGRGPAKEEPKPEEKTKAKP
jgi:hypothetical protein